MYYVIYHDQNPEEVSVCKIPKDADLDFFLTPNGYLVELAIKEPFKKRKKAVAAAKEFAENSGRSYVPKKEVEKRLEKDFEDELQYFLNK